MLTNLFLPQGYIGSGIAVYPVSVNPGGAVLFVNSATGTDSRGRVVFPGAQSAASTSFASANSQGPYGDPMNPLATIFGTNGALSLCKAGRGDLVVVLPGHTESIAAAKTIPTNVTVLGLGYGSTRPTISMNTAITAGVVMSAGSRIQNLILTGFGFAAITQMVFTAADCHVIDCRVVQADATNQALSGIVIAGADCVVARSQVDAKASAGASAGIRSNVAIARLTVQGCYILGDFSNAPLYNTGANHITDMLIDHNTLVQANGTAKACIKLTTSSTGIIQDNRLGGTTWSTAADAISGASNAALQFLQNYGFDVGGGVSGVLVPAAGTIA